MWFIIGIVLGVAMLALVLWLRGRNIKVTWYEWLIGVLGLALLLYTIQNVVGLLTEIEPTATWMFALVIGLPALILLAVAWQLVARRQRAGS
ncbi:putative reductive dehalogenase anchoring protein (rdhB) [marine sediment metagenome]|uniref:Putative reductive dehalogenase anchoring protein (RdhB) n=1 Tax=marine sediment metagenome TaxID=412755 RepID=X1NA02_9ZZZZ